MSGPLEALAAEAWRTRAVVEHQAHHRFARLSAGVARFDPSSPVAELLRAASLDEATHAVHCEQLAVWLGATLLDWSPARPIAPRVLGPREALLYEVVAACCLGETESLATLTLLLSKTGPGRVHEVLHQLARDEVRHAQAGWAHLAREAQQLDVTFLAAHLAPMLSGDAVQALFAPAPSPHAEDDGLYALGVVPHHRKKALFLEVLSQVFVPGLTAHGVDCRALEVTVAALVA